MAELCCAQLGGGSVLKRGKPNGNVHQRGAVGDGAQRRPLTTTQVVRNSRPVRRGSCNAFADFVSKRSGFGAETNSCLSYELPLCSTDVWATTVSCTARRRRLFISMKKAGYSAHLFSTMQQEPCDSSWPVLTCAELHTLSCSIIVTFSSRPLTQTELLYSVRMASSARMTARCCRSFFATWRQRPKGHWSADPDPTTRFGRGFSNGCAWRKLCKCFASRTIHGQKNGSGVDSGC